MNDETQRPISAAKEINMFFHCGLCLREKPPGISPRDFSRLQIGFTPIGLQVWCLRHDVNVVHIDFQGHQLPANSDRIEDLR